VQRRTFLRAASAGTLMAGGIANAQPGGSASFRPYDVEVAGNKIFVRRYGQGAPILMDHGFRGRA
jgi:hypothetical protein